MLCPLGATVTRTRVVLAALVMWAGSATAVESPAGPPQPELLTNLSQLRRCAERQPMVPHEFEILAEVLDADSAHSVLVLRDDSGVEFIRVGFKGPAPKPGAMVCLEGKACGFKPRSFGLEIVPGLVVDNDGVHSMKVESGTAFLHAGLNPVRVEWFNGPTDLGLTLEYEGPDLPRQRIPGSVLSHADMNPATGMPHLSAGLDYRCYEGLWAYLPDFSLYTPVKAGIATNFDLAVRTRNEQVGLEFSGFINIPRDGAYTFYLGSDDGARLLVGAPQIDLRVVTRHSPPPADALPKTVPEWKGPRWVTREGTVNFAELRGVGGELQLRVTNEDLRIDIFDSGGGWPNLPSRTRVKVSGVYENGINEDGSTSSGVLRVSSWDAVHPLPNINSPSTMSLTAAPSTSQAGARMSPGGAKPQPITTVAEIKALPRELAQQQLPVSIRGVLTACVPGYYGAVIQDSTRGIFVYLQDVQASAPLLQCGEFYQIDGVTGPGLFAPVIAARKITRLGAGHWPQPVRASRAQLVNGSLDTQYVEIVGVLTAVRRQSISLLMEEGGITLNLNEFPLQPLVAYQNALVRIRGCVFAPFNERTHELEYGTLLVGDPAVDVLQPAPRDPFQVQEKKLNELRLYDPEAGPCRLVKVRGQIIYGGSRQYFISDGTNGMRITTRNSDAFAIGDRVEAVGFLSFGGPAAELSEALMRKTGNAALPPPTRVSSDQLLRDGYADTLVRVRASLVNQWREGSQCVLELQSGYLAFRALIHNPDGSFPAPPSGSRLELTGVYAPIRNGLSDGTVNGFELLLSSPAGLRVLAMPPFWTLRRLIGLTGMLALVLCAVLVWNKTLHRQVQERSRQLELEIRNRERAERQRASETERARIARDLHDELGTGLTEVSLLASAGLGDIRAADKSHSRFRAIAEKARALVSALDVIVWAIDPKRNSLQSFADYLGSYAQELLSTSKIVCRFRIPIECEAVALPGAARHSLFLASKEALNNVIRHASATEVELQMNQVDHQLEIIIADNGRGFQWNAVRRGNGLTNLQERLGALHGQCRVESHPGQGTTVKLVVPLNGAG